jgi:hypothetical protein
MLRAGRARKVAHDSARSSRHMRSGDGQILRNLRSHLMTAADFRRIAGFSCRRQEICFAGLASRRVRKSDAYAGAARRRLWRGARDFPADSWRVGKDGTHACSPGGGERGCADGCTPNGVEAANR